MNPMRNHGPPCRRQRSINSCWSFTEAPLESPDPKNLGLDSQALRPHAQQLAANRSSWDNEQRRLRRAGFSDEQIADLLSDTDGLPRLLKSLYRGFWTDDSPQMEVRLRIWDGNEIVLESKSQKHFMLPWWIRRTDTRERFQSFDADISRGVAAILPKGYLNRERLLGNAGLLGVLAEHVVESRLCELDREQKPHRRLARLLGRAFQWNRK